MQLDQAAAVNQLAVTVTVAAQLQAAVANRLAVTATVAAQLQAVDAKPLAEMVAMQVLAESPKCIIAC